MEPKYPCIHCRKNPRNNSDLLCDICRELKEQNPKQYEQETKDERRKSSSENVESYPEWDKALMS